MLQSILKFADDFKKETAELKEKSPIHPAILLKGNPWKGEMVASTLVRIKRDGKWYKVHAVERMGLPSNSELLILKLNAVASQIKEHFIVSEVWGDLDENQED